MTPRQDGFLTGFLVGFIVAVFAVALTSCGYEEGERRPGVLLYCDDGTSVTMKG